MPNATVRANARTLPEAAPHPATASSTTERHARAYFDLEPKVRDLALMADLARSHAVDAFGAIPPNATEEEKRERSIALFAVIHLEEMVGDLEKAWDAGWDGAGSPASADEQSRTMETRT